MTDVENTWQAAGACVDGKTSMVTWPEQQQVCEPDGSMAMDGAPV
jgi:hypothetical protein